jgi:type II secretory pathway component PulF
MGDSFQQLMNSNPPAGIALAVLYFVAYVLIGLVPAGAVCYLFYFLLTLPMRRNERARWLLDLVELGVKDGRSPEAALSEAAASCDTELGVRFHLLAEYLRQGMRLSQALDHVPWLLPPPVAAMLKTGERIGDIRRVLPACRALLKDGVSHVRGAVNYVVLLVFAMAPLYVLVPLLFKVAILPKFREVFAGMFESARLPWFTELVFSRDSLLITAQIGLVCLLWIAVVAYLGGPRFHGWVRKFLPRTTDRLLWWLAWRRKRLQRDFSALLALLLDAGVPESEALGLAAEATGNLALIQRADRARAQLKNGAKLPDAVRALDDSGELHWRLANAAQRGGGFLPALSGWHEALDARAFQLEQTAAQVTTTLLVLFNGLIVASFVIAIFLALIRLINIACLW